VSDFPDHLDPARHRDHEGRAHQPWIRRAFVVVFAAAAVAALFNVFGQRSTTARVAGPDARLDIRGPTRVRGGLLFQQRITVRALRAIAHPRLVLASGWLDGLQVNTIEPSPQSEASRNGSLVLSYDQMAAGDKLEVFIDYQVNPTHVGRTDQDLEIDDATQPLVRLSRSLLTFP
jgi:hypothetical protein